MATQTGSIDLRGVKQSYESAANNAAPKTAAIAEEQRIYYRSNSSTKPNGTGLPTTWVTATGDVYNTNATTSTGWSRKITPIANGTGANVTKYLYLWTCIQRKTVSGTVTYGDILLDDSTTVIDGGKIVTGSVSANAVSATSGTFDTANIPNLNASKINAGTLNIGRIPSGALNSELAGDIANAATTASKYISEIDGDGIKVHAENNPTVNYSKIDADGLEVYKDSISVAKFGQLTRIGLDDSSRVEIDPSSIALIADTGLPALVSETSGSTITGPVVLITYNSTISSGNSVTITPDLSDVNDGANFYVTMSAYGQCTKLYVVPKDGTYFQSRTVRAVGNNSVTISFAKASSGNSITKNATIKVVSSITKAASPRNTAVKYTTGTKTVTVQYTPPNSIRISAPVYSGTFPDDLSYYNGIQYGVTDAHGYVRLYKIQYDKSIYIPRTDIYGKCYLQLNVLDEVPDSTDVSIVNMLNSKGWSDCIITED